MKGSRSSLYPPTHPPGSRVLLKVPENGLTIYDRLVVFSSSLFFVGGVLWVPALYAWAWKRFLAIPKDQKKRRAIYATILLSATALYASGPHRNPRVGEWVQVQKWSLWKSWFRFLALEIIQDAPITSMKNLKEDQAIIAVVPHGIFPFALGFSALSEMSEGVFGKFRAVVAPAATVIPWVRDVLTWVRAVGASRPSVDRALSQGSRIGMAPGGIAEMFEGYPKHLTHPDDEYTIVRKGFIRMAIKHGVPIIPVYCFGSTKLLKRLQLPDIVERVSLLLRVSLVLFFGKWGLPMPFRQKLLYVMGQPIFPPETADDENSILDQQVDEMQSRFCEELVRIFDRHKESYGWGHKSLLTLTR